MIRFAMLGCGAVADLYLPAFSHLERAECVAAVDIDVSMAREVAARYAIPAVYSDVADAAADTNVDAVIIGTPPDLHAAHVEACAQSRKHVLCEKPMAATIGDCQRIIDACTTHEVKLQMGHMKRFTRGNQKVKAIIDSGVLGTVFMAECHWDCAVPETIGSYREKKTTTGGSLQDHGPHSFDLIRWWTGKNMLEVSATLRSVHPDRPAEDACAVVLEHEDGFFSYHHMTRISYGREHSQDTYRIYGTDGTLVVRNDHHFPTMSLESPEIILYRARGTVQRFETEHGWNIDDLVVQNYPFYSQLEAFCDCILNDEEPRVTGEDGKHAMEAVIAAYISSSRNKKVRLPVSEEIKLGQLFLDMKERDRDSFGDAYTIEPRLLPPVEIREPMLAHRPPRTGEKWDDERHGLHDQAQWYGLQRRLRRKG